MRCYTSHAITHNAYVSHHLQKKTPGDCSLLDIVDRLLVLAGEVTEGLNNPCLVPLMVIDRKRLGDVGSRPKKALPEEATLR